MKTILYALFLLGSFNCLASDVGNTPQNDKPSLVQTPYKNPRISTCLVCGSNALVVFNPSTKKTLAFVIKRFETDADNDFAVLKDESRFLISKELREKTLLNPKLLHLVDDSGNISHKYFTDK